MIWRLHEIGISWSYPDFNVVYHWSHANRVDSRVVLGYLNSEALKFHIFVANRIQKMRHLTDPKQWHYVPTESNPADYASRGLSAQKIINTDWFEGPPFLWMKDLEISCQPTPGLQTGDPEVKTKTTLQTLVSNTIDWNDRQSHCATWNSVIWAVARIVRLYL